MSTCVYIVTPKHFYFVVLDAKMSVKKCQIM